LTEGSRQLQVQLLVLVGNRIWNYEVEALNYLPKKNEIATNKSFATPLSCLYRFLCHPKLTLHTLPAARC
jgi:hypothetical protein